MRILLIWVLYLALALLVSAGLARDFPNHTQDGPRDAPITSYR